jgi:hypothetical protein
MSYAHRPSVTACVIKKTTTTSVTLVIVISKLATQEKIRMTSYIHCCHLISYVIKKTTTMNATCCHGFRPYNTKKPNTTSTTCHPSLTSYTITTTMSVAFIIMVSKLATQKKFKMNHPGFIGCTINKKPQ